MNLGNQRTALRILKEITRAQPIEDSTLVLPIINRLKSELDMIYEDVKEEQVLHCFEKDDIRSLNHSLTQRQEFINSCLRFLCFAILRADSNAANAGSIPVSRRILESGLFEDKIMNQVIKANDTNADARFKKVIDPILLYCVHLFTYIINDLPQKLQDYIKLPQSPSGIEVEPQVDPNGIVHQIVLSLSRRIPAQQDMLMIMTSFLKMMTLNPMALEMVYKYNMVEGLFSLALNAEYHKHLTVQNKNIDRMMEFRMLINSLAYDRQELSDRILGACNRNLEVMIKEAWKVTEIYIKVHQETKMATPEQQEKAVAAFNVSHGSAFYDKLVSVFALLNYYLIEELEIMDNADYRSNIQNSIRKFNTAKLLTEMISIPSVNCGTDFQSQLFNDSFTFLQMLNPDSYGSYIQSLVENLSNHLESLREFMGVQSFDDSDLNPKLQISKNLPGLYSGDKEKEELIQGTTYELKLWFMIAKICTHIELLTHSEFLARQSQGFHSIKVYEEFNKIPKMVLTDDSIRSQIHKLQSLLDRYHTIVFVEQQNAQYDRYMACHEKLRQQFAVEQINWSDYKLDPEIKTEQQENRNMYYIYEYKCLDSLKWCNSVAREDPNLLFDLAESQIIQTHKCWKKARQFLARLTEMYRRKTKVVHIRNAQDSVNIGFNRNGAKLIITELKAIAKMCSDVPVSELFQDFKKCISTVVMIAGRVTWTLPDITDILSAKSLRNRGFFIVELLELGLVDVLKDLMLWSIRATREMDRLDGPKHIFVSQDIQDVLKSVLRVIKPLVEGQFMGMGNLQNFLVPFKTDLNQILLGAKQVESEQSLCAMRLRNHLYSKLYVPVSKLFFTDFMPEILAFAEDYQRDVSQMLCQIYSQLCGGFKQTLRSIGLTDLIISPKTTDEKTDVVVPSSAPKPMTYEIEVLKQMGFSEEQATKALQLSDTSFDVALELLLNNKVLSDSADPSAQAKAPNVEELQQSFESGQEEYSKQLTELFTVLGQSFGHAHRFFGLSPLSFQQQTVNNMFRLLKSEKKQYEEGKESHADEVFACITAISKNILTQKLAVPLWIEIDFTIHLLKSIHKNSHPLIVNHLSSLCIKIQNTAKELATQCTLPQQKPPQGLPKLEQEQANERHQVKLAERKSSDMQLLFNINEYLKLALIITGYLQIYQEARLIDALVKTEFDDNTEGLNTDQLKVLEAHRDDDKNKRNQLKNKWQTILNLIKPLQDGEKQKDVVDTSHDIALALFRDEQEAGTVITEFFVCIDAILKAMSNVHYSFASEQQDGLSWCISRSVQILKAMGDIQSIGSFDFRKQFIQAEMIKTIFDLKVIDGAWECKQTRLLPQDKYAMIIIREVLEGLWLQPKDLTRVYETLIKRQMFYQFKQTFKREENKELFDVLKTSIVAEKVTSPQLAPQLGRKDFDQANLMSSNKKHRTKSKPMQTQIEKQQSRSMRAKSEEKKLPKTKSVNQMISTIKQKQVWPLAVELCSPKLIKKFIKRTESCNKQKFNDFLGYFDSGAFGMNIKRVDLFIAAVAKICLIKTEVDTKEGKQLVETKIMLKRNVLRDLLTDPDFHSIVLAQPPIVQQNRFQFEQDLLAWKNVSLFTNPEQQAFTTRYQQEFVAQLLECLVQQTKGYRMDLIKLFRDPTCAVAISHDKYKVNDTVVQVQTIKDGKQAGQQALCVSPESTSVRKDYFYDMFSIMNVFVSMLALNLPIAEIILRHNDRKTVKFLFRNMFLLFSLSFQGNLAIVLDPVLSSSPQNAQKLTVMCNFLNHLMISNFGTRQTDIIVRDELQRILITQLAKQISSIKETLNSACQGWTRDAKLVNAFGPVWLLTNFIMNKFTNEDENAKDVQAAILQKKFKHMRLQRIQMTKLLMLECQHQVQKHGSPTSLSLLDSLQCISHVLINETQFFIAHAKSRFYQQCIIAVSNLVKMFDSSTVLFQARPKRPTNQLMPLELLKEMSKVEGTSELMEMLEQGEFAEEGEVEMEEMEEDLDDDMPESPEEVEDSQPPSSDSYGSDDMSDINQLSSPSESRGSFDPGASYGANPLGSEDYSEDYGSSENSWNQGFLNIQEVDEEQPEVIVTTKQDHGSPRHYMSDYDEEDSSSNFQAGLVSPVSEEEEDEQNESDEYGSQNLDGYEAEQMYHSFHSYSEHEVDRTPVYTREENSFDEFSDERSRSRSLANRPDAHTTQIIRDQGANRAQNPFAEPPLNFEVNMPHGMVLSHQVSIERILENTINDEITLRQIECYGEFGYLVMNAKPKLLEFRKHLRSNSAVFRQCMTHLYAFLPVEKNTLEESKQPVSTFQVQGHEAGKRIPTQRKNALEIEGMDPLFMENLTSVGLQNIADSHQIHNRISTQARGGIAPHSRGIEQTPVEILSNFISFLGSQTPSRRLELLNSIQASMQHEMTPEMLAAARNLYTANGADFTRLMNELRERSRAGTLNVTANELVGAAQVGDFSQQRRFLRPRLISNSSVSYDVRGNDDTVERVQDPQPGQRPRLGSMQVKFVEIDGKNKIQLKGTQYMQNFFQLLQDHIVKYESDLSGQTVTQQCETIMSMHLVPSELDAASAVHVKLEGLIQLGMTILQNQRELEKDNPAFIETLGSSMAMIDRVPFLRSCITMQVLAALNREVQAMIKHRDNTVSQSKPYLSDLTTFDVTKCAPRRLNLYEVATFALSCICQMQEIASKSAFQKVQKKREILQPLATQPVLQELARLIGGINLDQSIMEGLLETVQTLFEAVNNDTWLLWGEDQIQDQSKFHKEVFSFLLKIFKSIQGAFKTNDQSLIPVSSICKLFLSLLNDQWKPSTQTTSMIRKALSICCFDKESSEMVSSHIQSLIDQLLSSTIVHLKQWGSQQPITVTILKITQLLSLISGLDKTMQCQLCSESLLLDVFNTANSILQQETAAEQDPAKQLSKFLQRQSIRDLISLLISLSDFSMKTDLSKALDQDQVGDQEMVSTFQILEQQAATSDDIEKLLSQHVSRTSPHYPRFKAMATFFLANRRLLNQFIQVNQQLISPELKNLVLRIPSLLEFDTKRFIWRVELKKQYGKHKKIIRISVNRDRAFDDSFAHLQSLKTEDWKSTFDIQFVNEDGIDQGGLTKEWFTLLSKQMFDENLALFRKAQGQTYFFNPKSTVQGNFVDLFNFVGKIIGKALWEQQLLDCYFIKAFYKIILDLELDHHDLEDYDQGLYKSLIWILENNSVEQLSSYFVETMDYFGTQREVELVSDGRNKLVTDDNKKEYVRLVANFKLDHAIREQKTAFLNGFYSIVPKDLLRMFDNRELELLISGLQKIDIDDLKENTLYTNGYNARSRPILLLWEVLQELDNTERAEFLQFVTGSSKVPIEGFKGLRGPDGFQKFTIARIQTHGELRLPQSHTCMNILDLPEYKDKETLKRMLLIAIREGKNFGIA